MERVLFVTGMGSTKYGTLEKWLLLLGETVRTHGLVLYLHYDTEPASSRYVRDLGRVGVVLLCESPPRSTLGKIAYYWRLIRKVNPAVVHSMFSSKSIYAASLAGVKKNYWTNALELPDVRPTSRLSASLIGRLCQIFPASDAIRDQMVSAGYRESKLHTLYFGLPVEYLDCEIDAALAEGLLARDDSVLLCSVAHFRNVKGTDLLLEAMSIAIRQGAKIRLIQVGIDTKRHPEYLAQACALGIAEHVDWIGIVDDAHKYIGLCDIYVQPSRREAMSFTVMEASYQGKPVVAFGVGGIPEAVIDGHTGLLAARADVSDLAAKIIRLANDMELRRTLGVNGRAHVEDNLLSEKGIAKLVCDYYLAHGTAIAQ